MSDRAAPGPGSGGPEGQTGDRTGGTRDRAGRIARGPGRDTPPPEDGPLPSRPLAEWVRHGRIRIVEPQHEIRLDRFLGQRFPYRSRTEWVELIRAGRIRVDGRPCRPSQMLRIGTLIEYLPEPRPEPEVAVEISILHEDPHLLVVDKPPNLPVHPSGRYFRNTLLAQLLSARGETLDRPGIRIVHRLDRETSGVLIFGKGREMTRRLATQFQEGSARKRYLVLVHGVPGAERFTVDRPLGRNPDSRVRKSVGVVPEGEGRPARTDFRLLARGPEHSLLVARPRTGRLHQIRVHAGHSGHPVVGDKLYGLDERFFLKLAEGETLSAEDQRRLLLDRQCLHAWRLRIRHPWTGRPATFEAPLPADLQALCLRLEIPIPEFLAAGG